MLKPNRIKERIVAWLSAQVGKRNKRVLIGQAVLVVGCAIAVVYLSITGAEALGGVSLNADVPVRVIQVEIVNAAGVKGVGAQVAKILDGYAYDNVEVKVVADDEFTIRRLPETFLIARVADEASIRELAGEWGLSESDVDYRPLENDYRQVSATLVLGEDWERYRVLSGVDRAVE